MPSNVHKTNRRKFIAQTVKASLALSFVGVSDLLLAQTASQQFSQVPLPYNFNELGVIDELTMKIHYGKHAAGYTKNLNEAYTAELGKKHKTLEKILDKISKYSTKMRNNAGGHYNHEFFWKCMKPVSSDQPRGKLLEAINTNFGSFAEFKKQFVDAAKSRFGSGWVWLVQIKDEKLAIGSTPNQDNPLMNVSTLRGKPILALDVWEHAYYLKYQNKRADYIENWFKIIDWDFVAQQLV